MLATRKRTTAAMTGVAGLLAGALVMAPSISTAVPAVSVGKSGAVEIWGSDGDNAPVRTTHLASVGPWTAVSQGLSADFGITADKTLKRLAGTAPALDVPSDLTSVQVKAVSTAGSIAAAVKTDGSVQLWGTARGLSLAPLSVADLGGSAADVSVGTSLILIRLENGKVRTVSNQGLQYFQTEDGVDVTTAVDVQAVGITGVARLDGGGLTGMSTQGNPVSFPAAVSGNNLEDPVASFGLGNGKIVAATEGGSVYTFFAGDASPLEAFPTELAEGKVIDVAATTSAGYFAALTDAKEVIVWGPAGADDYAAMATVPEEVADHPVADLVGGLRTFAAIVTAPLPVLSVATTPTVAGTAKVDSTLTGTPATFNGAPDAITNKWLANGTAISGATGTTYKLTATELGKNITFESTATRVEGNASLVSTSTEVGPVGPSAPVASKTVVSAPSKAYGTAGTATVTVSNTGGKPNNGTVTLTGAGAAQTKALVGGKATFALAKNLAPKAYTLSAKYNGSADLIVSTGAVKYTVAKGKVKAPAFKANKAPTSKKAGKGTVTVTAPSGLAKATGKVTITLKGKSSKKVTATLSGGKKTFTLPKLKKGTYKVTVSYAGDKNYGSAKSKTYSLKIKK